MSHVREKENAANVSSITNAAENCPPVFFQKKQKKPMTGLLKILYVHINKCKLFIIAIRQIYKF
jgi:hypothetical protein